MMKGKTRQMKCRALFGFHSTHFTKGSFSCKCSSAWMPKAVVLLFCQSWKAQRQLLPVQALKIGVQLGFVKKEGVKSIHVQTSIMWKDGQSAISRFRDLLRGVFLWSFWLLSSWTNILNNCFQKPKETFSFRTCVIWLAVLPCCH